MMAYHSVVAAENANEVSWFDTLKWTPCMFYTSKKGVPGAVRNAQPTQAFWQAWNADKENLERHSAISVSKASSGFRIAQWAKVGSQGYIIAPEGLAEVKRQVCAETLAMLPPAR